MYPKTSTGPDEQAGSWTVYPDGIGIVERSALLALAVVTSTRENTGVPRRFLTNTRAVVSQLRG